MVLPETFIASMKEILGEEYENYITSYEDKRVQGLRINTGKISVEDFLKITPFHLTPVPWTENGFYYMADEPVTKHPHYYAGLYYIQEPSAMIPASQIPIEPGERVLDLCAAPGGKATELGARLGRKGILVANDISHSRAKGLLKNLELFGVGNILVTSETPEKLLSYFAAYFDKILIDAPCSGEGMFRKDPAMIKSWEERGPEYYADIQRGIVKSAAKLLRPGGKILYSTCTFSLLENERIMEEFLQESPDFQLLPMHWYEGFSKGYLPHCIRVWPHKVQGEGHFAALLEKSGERSDENRSDVERVKNRLPSELKEFIAQIPFLQKKEKQIELREDKAYLLPEELPSIRGLRFLRTGLYLGECKQKRFEPSQALAMYLKLSDYPLTFSLDSKDERVLRYLKGESIEDDGRGHQKEKGWILVAVDGFPLGWAKAGNGILKNKYYPGWRIQ